jgi:hypothetical protein
MRPFALLLGIVTGSAVAIALGLGLTAVVFMFLPEHRDRLAPEQGPLLKGFAWAAVIAALAATCFIGELRRMPRRGWWHAVLLAAVTASVAVYWPR